VPVRNGETALDNDGLIINGQLRSFSYYRGHAALQEALAFAFEPRHNADKWLVRARHPISSKNFLLLSEECGFFEAGVLSLGSYSGHNS
jgi:hypothetical protein